MRPRKSRLRSGLSGEFPYCPMPLAHAFLALCDDGKPRRRSPRLAVAAVAATFLLAFGIPLGWLAGQPVAALGSKIALLDDDAV